MDGREIYLAGGCFWGTEAYLGKLPGVLETEVGYANSRMADPSYEDVCWGDTNAVECVRVRYDASVIPLPLLLDAYLRTIDPTSVNRQGNDRGSQYRTGIYWTNEADAPVVREKRAALERQIGSPVAIEVMPLESFYPAEPHHQKYLQKNPMGYCHVSLADARAFAAEHADEFGPGLGG